MLLLLKAISIRAELSYIGKLLSCCTSNLKEEVNLKQWCNMLLDRFNLEKRLVNILWEL